MPQNFNTTLLGGLGAAALLFCILDPSFRTSNRRTPLPTPTLVVPPIIGSRIASTTFASLPFEIRLKIWELSQVPRVLQVQEFPDNGKRQWRSRSSPPNLFAICQDSRAFAFRRYKFCHTPHMRIFLDPEIDTLFFGAPLFGLKPVRSRRTKIPEMTSC
jgi:hypothetical protein